MKNIEWVQVIVAFILGVLLSGFAMGLFSNLKNRVRGAAGG